MIIAAALCLALAAPSQPITPESVAALLDPIFAKCSPDGTPGASVAVVYDGKIIFTKGYGIADVVTKVPVDPETHLFRAASVSKLITATAVMQLVEQGKVDLDKDVNTYLKKPIVPAAFGQPVTLRNLLQHAAGFDDEFLGMARRTPDERVSLEDYLATGLPHRVFPPGHFVSYSNHSLALAGLVVEQVSGQPFADYARDHVFAPLGMTHSSFDLVPDATTPLAHGYSRSLLGGKLQPVGYDYPCTIPASTLCTTAPDMARFMLAHLGHGTWNNAQILRPETTALMHDEHIWGPPGIALGFFDRRINDRRCLSHTGLILGYATLLMIYPDENFGLYVTLNSEDAILYDRAERALMDAFFPKPEMAGDEFLMPPNSFPEWEKEATRYYGIYRHTRYPRNSFLKFGLLVSGRTREIEIAPGSRASSLLVRRYGAKDGQSIYRALHPGLFRPGQAKDVQVNLAHIPPMCFLGEANAPASFYVDGSNAYERIQWWETTSVLTKATAACFAVLLAWPLARVLLHFRRRRNPPTRKPLPRWLTRAANLHVAALLLFGLGIAAILGSINPFDISYGVPTLLWPVLCLPVLAIATGLPALLGLLRAQLNHQGIPLERLHLLLTLTASTLLLLILNYWNLLGFHTA